MNIIVVNDFAYVNGGAGQVALNSAVALAQKGHQVILFTAVGPIASNLLEVGNLKVICLEQHDILNNPNRFRAIFNGIWNFKAAAALKEILNNLSRKDTVIHIHTCSKALSSSVVHLARKMNFKMIYHLHDYGCICPNLGLYNYPKQQKCKIKPLSLKCALLNCDSRSYSHKVWRVLRQLAQVYCGGIPQKLSYFVAVSNFSLELFKPFLPENAQVTLISNPILIEKKPPVSHSNDTFVFVGRLSKEKDPLTFAKAAQKLKIRAIFVGDGDCASEIIREYPEAVITGWVDLGKMQQYLREATAIVFSSRWYETQGLVVLEAAANGVPAIVADNTAATDFIIDGETGLIFKTGDVADLTAKIKLLMQDDLAAEMGLNAYRRFWENPPTLEQHVTELEKLYQAILEIE